jgi:predicted porin
MRRTALAVAVGGLFIAPAAQAQIVFGNEQLGTLQLYGKLYPQFGYATSKDATQPGSSVSTLVSTTGTLPAGAAIPTPGAHKAVDVQNSYIGFRGERDLHNVGAGLKFIWQIEQSVNFDVGNGVWSNRNSFLGARTNFGTVKLGNMDTIYKEYGDTMQMFGIASGNFISASNMLSHIGLGNSNNARFHERRANSMQLESPQFAGFTAGYQYSPDETRDTTQLVGGGCVAASPAGTTATGTCGRDGSLHSYGVKWDTQRFYASVHQEIHNDSFGGSSNVGQASLSNTGTNGAHSRDSGTRFSGEWRYNENQRIVFDISRLRYRERGQAAGVHFESYNHSTWAIGWDGGFGGPLRLAVQFIRGNEGNCSLTGGVGCSTTGLTGSLLNAGVRWRFDRQTFVYLIGSKLQNGPSARYDNWANADPARGADILQFALGASYTF